MRHKPSIVDLLREETGREFVPAAPSDEERWQWLDYFILPRPDLLELTGMPKGRFESYLRRRLLDLKHFGVGMGTHIRYKPLEALKLMAIDGLSQAGAWDWCMYQAFRHNGSFDFAIRGYQSREYPRKRRPDPIIMNSPHEKFLMENPGRTSPYRNDLEYNVARVRGQWPPKDWYRLEFDVATFIEMMVPKAAAFLEKKGIKVEDR
jgi:hypothetical protein